MYYSECVECDAAVVANVANEMEEGEVGDANVESTPIPDEGLLGDINTTSSADYMMNSLELI